MSVNTTHPDYNSVIERWKLVRAIADNKAKNYIRTPDVNDKVRSAQYREDAILTNFTNLTKVGLTGLVFRKPPLIQLPPELDYLYDDVTGGGINIWQFSQHVVADVLQTGRYGFLVDYHDDGQKSHIKPYAAENILNWKTKTIAGKYQPWLITLCESIVKDAEDPFSQDVETQYRVLRLSDDNVYYQEVYNQTGELVEVVVPKDYNNQPFNFIPFVFVGSENNDWTVDNQPLYDLAVVNLGHYRNSADYEESIFITGQPYLVINVGETSEEEFTSANPNGVSFGSRRALVLRTGGSASLLQANANQLVAQAMREKLEQAAAIGARLIAPPGGRETAEAAKIRYGSQHSALYTLTSNISWAMEDALKIACLFHNAPAETVEFKLNDQFYDEAADPNIIAQQIMLLDRGVISSNDIRDYGRRTGILTKDDNEIDMEVDQDNIVRELIDEPAQ